jgi:hypothetical protein
METLTAPHGAKPIVVWYLYNVLHARQRRGEVIAAERAERQ